MICMTSCSWLFHRGCMLNQTNLWTSSLFFFSFFLVKRTQAEVWKRLITTTWAEEKITWTAWSETFLPFHLKQPLPKLKILHASKTTSQLFCPLNRATGLVVTRTTGPLLLHSWPAQAALRAARVHYRRWPKTEHIICANSNTIVSAAQELMV